MSTTLIPTAGSGDTCEIKYTFDSTAGPRRGRLDPRTTASTVDLGGFNGIVSISTEFDAGVRAETDDAQPKKPSSAPFSKPIIDLLSFPRWPGTSARALGREHEQP